MTEKKYKGYGYHGGGRKPSSPDGQPRRTTLTISGTRNEIGAIRKLAKVDGKSISRYVIERVLPKEVIDGILPAELMVLVAENAREIAKGVADKWNRMHAMTADQIDKVELIPECINCAYIKTGIDDTGAMIGACGLGNYCGCVCEHYKNKYGD